MFFGCENLEKIYSQFDWTTNEPNTWNMFTGCTKLTGGQGTVCSGEAETDFDEFARPDGLAGEPGYFTAIIELYTEYIDEFGVLVYYCDKQRGARTGIVELYEPHRTEIQRIQRVY